MEPLRPPPVSGIMPSSRRRGLSILELLVVIAIILIVAAIIITVLAKVYRVVKALGGNRATITAPVYGEEHPAANADWKHTKSATLSTGGIVDPSQLAYGSPAANRWAKQTKSFTFSTGGIVEASQLA